MNTLGIITCLFIILAAGYGYKSGFVRMLIPLVSGILSLVVLFLLKDWLFSFLFKWAIFQGEHILARVVVVLLLYILGILGFKWLIGILKLLTKLPIVHGANKLLGLLTGLTEGFLAVWLFLFIIQLKQGNLFGIDFNKMIEGNAFLQFLSVHNLVTHLISTLFSSWIF
jgi:hypothetical protein